MSKFKIGDRVRVVQITDLDRELGDPNRVITNPAHPDALDWYGVPLIGLVGVVTDVFNDYLDAAVHFDHMGEGDPDPAFVDDDLVPVRRVWDGSGFTPSERAVGNSVLIRAEREAFRREYEAGEA